MNTYFRECTPERTMQREKTLARLLKDHFFMISDFEANLFVQEKKREGVIDLVHLSRDTSSRLAVFCEPVSNFSQEAMLSAFDLAALKDIELIVLSTALEDTLYLRQVDDEEQEFYLKVEEQWGRDEVFNKYYQFGNFQNVDWYTKLVLDTRQSLKNNDTDALEQMPVCFVQDVIPVVHGFEELVDRIRLFNDEISSGSPAAELLINKLSLFKHWYYLPDLNLFGPSKYLAFMDLNATSYNALNGFFDGRFAEYWIDQLGWFRIDQGVQLMEKLEVFLHQFDKKANRAAVIHTHNKSAMRCS